MRTKGGAPGRTGEQLFFRAYCGKRGSGASFFPVSWGDQLNEPGAHGHQFEGAIMNFRSLRIAMLATAALLLAACIPELIADAGPDQAVNEGASVTVRAGANVLDHIVNYKWVQTAGPKVNFKVSKKGVLT